MGKLGRCALALVAAVGVTVPALADVAQLVASDRTENSKSGPYAPPDIRESAVWTPRELSTKLDIQNTRNEFGLDCHSHVKLVPSSPGWVGLKIDAPCRAEEPVALRHAGLVFDIHLDGFGQFDMKIPILHIQGEIESVFAQDQTVKLSTKQVDVPGRSYVAVAWSADQDTWLEVNTDAQTGNGVLRMGDGSGRVVDVYARDFKPSGPRVERMFLRSIVTAANCAHSRSAKIRAKLPNQPVVTYDLSIAAPGCLQVGTSMVLKNVLQDLKAAWE